MSYDLMVFDPDAAPAEPKAFIEWYSAQTKWSESHGYNDPQVSTERLRAWFMDIIETFPPMNGPLSNEDDIDNPKTTDYSIGRTAIYAAFAWSQAEAAYQCVRELAQKHGIGFFDVSSSDGAVWLRASDGSYKVAFHATQQRSPTGIFSKIRKWFGRGSG